MVTAESAFRLIVKGKVQGVGYRFWMVNIARKLNVRGWVCNLANGSVEGIICGRLENIEQLIKACRGGPSLAEVSSLEVIKIGSVPGDVSELFEQRSFHQS